MMLSERTLRILKNFATINPSIVIEKGSRLRTISASGTIYAVAEIEEEFPHEFGVFSLGKLLKILGMLERPELEFLESHVLITQGAVRTRYSYCKPELIISPPKKDIRTPAPVVELELREETFSQVQRAMSVFEFDTISFLTTDDGKLWVTTRAGNRSSDDSFSVEIGETDERVEVNFSTESLRLIPGNYLVRMAEGISEWVSQDDDGLRYWIAPKAGG